MKNRHCTKEKSRQQRGFTLVETLVAITILLIGTVAPMTIASKGLQASHFALEQNIAFFLAQEGIELMVHARNEQGIDAEENGTDSSQWYLNLIIACGGAVPCTLGFDASDTDLSDARDCRGASATNCRIYYHPGDTIIYTHSSTGGQETQYSRFIEVSQTGGNRVRVISTVTWESQFYSNTKEVRLETYLYDTYSF